MTNTVEIMDASAASGATAALMFIQPRAIISVPPMSDTGFHITENWRQSTYRAAEAVELKYQYGFHTRNTRDDEHQHNLKSGNLIVYFSYYNLYVKNRRGLIPPLPIKSIIFSFGSVETLRASSSIPRAFNIKCLDIPSHRLKSRCC